MNRKTLHTAGRVLGLAIMLTGCGAIDAVSGNLNTYQLQIVVDNVGDEAVTIEATMDPDWETGTECSGGDDDLSASVAAHSSGSVKTAWHCKEAPKVEWDAGGQTGSSFGIYHLCSGDQGKCPQEPASQPDTRF